MNIYEEIIARTLPAQRGMLRQESAVDTNKALRKLFKDLKLTGIRVTKPKHRCSYVYIHLPELHQHNSMEERQACSVCQLRHVASQKLEKIVVSAFPDMGDKSDYSTDYFDFAFMIH